MSDEGPPRTRVYMAPDSDCGCCLAFALMFAMACFTFLVYTKDWP